MNVYNNVVELSRKKGLTISKLEQKAGLANGTIGKWKTKSPLVESLVKVATALGVTVNRLLKE